MNNLIVILIIVFIFAAVIDNMYANYLKSKIELSKNKEKKND